MFSASSAESFCEEHATALYLCSLVLTGDHHGAVEAAARAIVLAGVDPEIDRGLDRGETRRALVRLVYEECRDLSPAWPRPPDGAEASDELVARLARITRHSREVLALCVYGGHTVTQAATVLGLSGDTAHHFLTWGLRDLAALVDEKEFFPSPEPPVRSSPTQT